MDLLTNLLDRIREQYPGYSASTRLVAGVVLARPHAVIDMSIGALAHQAGVSEPTVVRFCRSLGLAGFREFRLRLAQELAAASYVHPKLSPGDDPEALIEKVGRATVQVLASVVTQLHGSDIERAVTQLASAKRVEFYGFGASGVVAADAYHKFFRLGIPCCALSDSHLQCMSASTLEPQDVVVAISHTGRSVELIENVRLARQSGAYVLGITSPDSPLAGKCTQVLGVRVNEDTDVFPPMLSRLAHLMLLDILVTGVALRRGKEVTARLKKMKDALAAKKLRGGGDQHDQTT